MSDNLEKAHKERPIIFTGEMVRAILEGRKTQTRRVVKPSPIVLFTDFLTDHPKPMFTKECSYGVPGDRLWVREQLEQWDDRCAYAVNDDNLICDSNGVQVKWKWKRRVLPARFMPRWASRIALEITNVRMERVQDISEADAIAEGAPGIATHEYYPRKFIDSFAVLWDSINAKRGFGWSSNCWVWVVEFKKL